MTNEEKLALLQRFEDSMWELLPTDSSLEDDLVIAKDLEIIERCINIRKNLNTEGHREFIDNGSVGVQVMKGAQVLKRVGGGIKE